jgi:hypothetical protein
MGEVWITTLTGWSGQHSIYGDLLNQVRAKLKCEKIKVIRAIDAGSAGILSTGLSIRCSLAGGIFCDGKNSAET